MMSEYRKLLKTGLALLGAAATLYALEGWAEAPKKAKAAETTAAEKKGRDVEITVTEKGYEPSPIKVKKGEPLRLLITRKTEKTCANEILIHGTDVNVPLPLNKQVEVEFTPKKSGELKYGCAMGMMIAGVLLVE